MATVQIVMAVYNGERYLAEQIESLRAQTFTDWELLVSDDCSTDASLSIIKRYREADNRIKLVQNDQHYGRAKQHFMALFGLADATYVMACDQDDVWDADKIEITLKEMRAHEAGEKPVLVCTDLRVVDDKMNLISPSFLTYSGMDSSKRDLGYFLASCLVTGCTMMVNHYLLELLQEKANTDQIIMHDWWASLLASTFGEIVYIDRAAISYRQHGDNSVGATRFSILDSLKQIDLKRRTERAAIVQAGEFYRVFGASIPSAERAQIAAFLSIEQANPFLRIILMTRAGIWRRGFLRNAGTLLVFLTLNMK